MKPGESVRAANLRGIFWMTAATCMAGLTGGMVRKLAGDYNAFELVFFRGVVGFIILMPWMLRMAMKTGLGTTRVPLYIARAVLSYSGIFCLFFALRDIPVAEVYAVLFTTPLFTILLAVLILKEGAGPVAFAACAVGMIGALVILQPENIPFSLAAAAVLITAVCYASANICIKGLSRTEDPVKITLYNTTIMLLLAVIPLPFVWVTPQWADMPWLIGLGVFNTLGALFHTRAISAADARVVQPFSFLRMLWATLVGFLLFGELPGVWTWTGAVIIFASSSFVLRIEARRKEAAVDK